MCGIFALLNYNNTNLDTNFIGNAAQRGQHRGPDSYKIDINNNIFLAFYRLAINGLDKKSGQPLKYNNKILTFRDHRLFTMFNVKNFKSILTQ